MRARALLVTVALLFATACGGQTDSGTPSGTGFVPTAAPFPSVPSPVIVTGTATPAPNGTPAGGGGTGEQVYTVVAGDVLGTIADKFDVPASQLRVYNNLTTDTLQIGQKLKIPARTAGTVTPPASPGGVTTYTVKAGDTAFGIALQFDTTVAALERANGVPKDGLDNLQLGQVVKLPPPGER